MQDRMIDEITEDTKAIREMLDKAARTREQGKPFTGFTDYVESLPHERCEHNKCKVARRKARS